MLLKPHSIRIFNLGLFALLYFLRRPADALYPAVWNEDGVFNIPQAIANGWASLFTPVNGYLIIPSKIITLLSLGISGSFYPEFSYFLTFVFTLGVLVVLTSKYVDIKGRAFLPLIIVLLPYDPETFSTPLMIIWWTSLLLFVPLFSAKSDAYTSPAAIYIVTALAIMVASMSTPLCIFLLPVMILRVFVTRSRLDYFALGLWSLLAIYQYSLIRAFPEFEVSPSQVSFSNFRLWIPQYFGNYFYHDSFLSADTLLIYLLFLVYVIAGIWTTYQTFLWRDIQYFYGAAAFIMSLLAIASSVMRIGLQADPFLAGPRYFFLPFIFLSVFFLTSLGNFSKPAIRSCCLAALVLSCTLTWIDDFSKFYRIHDPLSWRLELQTCRDASGPYPLAIQHDGNTLHVWEHPYFPQACQQIMDSGILARLYDWRSLPEF